MPLKLLIADDAPDIAEIVAFAARMTWSDCQVTTVGTGEEALQRFEAETPDLVVLDIAMPPPDGFDVCRRIRQVSQVPILVLTVRNATIDKIRALDLGADDFVTKPFDHLELVARLRALVRRSQGPPLTTEAAFVAGELAINFACRSVQVSGEEVKLTPTEFRLLEELIRHAGMVLTHQVLLDRVWGPEWIGDPNYLKVFVRRLRQKLGDDAENPKYIQTEWGIGYRFLPSN